MYNLTFEEAADAVSFIDFAHPVKERAMMAFVSLFGTEATKDFWVDPGSEAHDDAWNALGALEFHAGNSIPA